MVRKLTRKEFILRAQNIHGDLYDYSKSDYINIRTKLTIICDVHGEFKQIPRDHISSKSGCPKCASKAMGAKLSRTTSNFIELAHETHNSKYNYSKANYKGNKNKIIIICPKHGEFTQIPKNHIHKNYGCPKCAPNKKLTIKEFIITANKIHNNKYDYSKAKYINTRTKLTIICPVHREFNQRPNDHISDSNGCPKCANNISRSESKWLDLLNIPNDQRQISIWIKGALFKVDGYCSSTDTIYEFYGDYWHGNPTKYDPNCFNTVSKQTFGNLYKKTIQREQKLITHGFKVISIWESDFNNTSTDKKK